jgi:hypothetical protein
LSSNLPEFTPKLHRAIGFGSHDNLAAARAVEQA